MNREQRRRETAQRREQPVELRLYDRAGQLFATHYRSQGQPVDAQIRVASASAGFRSVAEAEAAGRLDLIRCFLHDREAGGGRRIRVYREAADGRDRMPGQRPDLEYQTLAGGDAFPEVVLLGNRILERFPAGTIWPFEAYVLAFVRLQLGDHWDRSEPIDRIDMVNVGAAVHDFIRRSGYADRWTEAQIVASLARMPELSAQAEALGCWRET